MNNNERRVKILNDKYHSAKMEKLEEFGEMCELRKNTRKAMEGNI